MIYVIQPQNRVYRFLKLLKPVQSMSLGGFKGGFGLRHLHDGLNRVFVQCGAYVALEKKQKFKKSVTHMSFAKKGIVGPTLHPPSPSLLLLSLISLSAIGT